MGVTPDSVGMRGIPIPRSGGTGKYASEQEGGRRSAAEGHLCERRQGTEAWAVALYASLLPKH